MKKIDVKMTNTMKMKKSEEIREVMYASARLRNGNFRNHQLGKPSQFYNTQRKPPVAQSSGNWRDRSDSQTLKPRGKNPPSKPRIQIRCRICQSINHWESKCPDKEAAEATFLINEVVLHANNDVVLKSLLSETWSCDVLDCGPTNTVCGTK